MPKKRQPVRLICWKEDRAAELAEGLESIGLEVDFRAFGPSTMKDLSNDPPCAVVIDLGRLPAQGRDVGIALRTRAGTRHLPLVFVDGADEKVQKIRELLPDAVFTRREGLQQAVEDAIADPPIDPVVPSSVFAGYSGTPLPKKLGIKAGTTRALVNPPDDFSSTLGRLPGDVEITSTARRGADVTLWFVLSSEVLGREIDDMAAVAGDGRLWICWPKKASGVSTDVTQNIVRATGLAAGIVDFKICAIDETWSGLCFTTRKA
jgi:hypothetical protein